MSEAVIVNGTPRGCRPGQSLNDLMSELLPAACRAELGGGSPTGVAVAINDVVVARGRWAQTKIIAGDRIEIVTAVQGG